MASEKHCVRALDQHEEKLSANPRVQGLGVVAREGETLDSENCAVAVYVEKKVPDEEIAEEHRLPTTLLVELEGARHEVPVRVIEQGPVTLEGPGTETLEIGPEIPGLATALEPEDGGEE